MAKVTSYTVQVLRRSGAGRKAEPTEETWDERQARVNAERAERRAQRLAEQEAERNA